MKEMSSCKKLFVVAIDFGTTYSGYAYQSVDDFNRDPLTVRTNQKWTATNIVSEKTPSCVLFDANQQFVKFGFEAEEEYSELVQNGFHEDDDSYKKYFFFRQFKMILCKQLNKENEITLETEIADETRKKMPAIIVFSEAIAYLKRKFLQEMERQYGGGITVNDVEWVLTVPAIWDDMAKEFMTKAAVQAGLDSKQVTLALEPEAASIYCQHLSTEKSENENAFKKPFIDEHYMVLDLGGGTADITVHHKDKNGNLHEIIAASGGPWGGKEVEGNFINLLEDIFDKKTIKTLKREYLQDYLELCRSFEIKIKSIQKDAVNLNLPMVLMETYQECTNSQSLQQTLKDKGLQTNINIKRAKLLIKGDSLKNLFTPIIEKLVQHIKQIVEQCSSKEATIQTVLLVGGFSECQYIVDAISNGIQGVRVIRPPDAILAVLKGAVIFGHQKDAIISRCSKFTYGYEAWPQFRIGRHKEEYKIEFGNQMCCQKVFQPIVVKGDKVSLNEPKLTRHRPVSDDQMDMCIAVYYTENGDTPFYIDDPGVFYLGKANLPLTQPEPGNDRTIEGRFFFGETSIRLEAQDLYNHEIFDATFTCLC